MQTVTPVSLFLLFKGSDGGVKQTEDIMPHYIDTETLNALSETQLRSLYATLYAEWQALPPGSDAAAAHAELLKRISAIIRSKRLRPQDRVPRLGL